jgi:uncharacterized protein YfkK (UPF0435 family)
LRAKGIDDLSRIKMEDEYGQINEVSWDQLSKREQLNILNDSSIQPQEYDQELDNDEINLINSIRRSNMSPAEFLEEISNRSVNNFIQNQQPDYPYQVDDLDDDTLFVTDLMARIGQENLSNEEIEEMLNNAKQNEEAYKKQVDGIRNEYRQLEDNNRAQEQAYQQEAQLQQYNQFKSDVVDSIRDFASNGIGGLDLNMDNSELDELYDFITGVDGAGVSVFGKALNHPQTLVQMAWFALNGEKAFQDINNYWASKLSQARDYSYRAGYTDGRNGNVKNNSHVVITNN